MDLIDYVDVVAHIFNKERRKHYDLEELWGDAEVTYLEDSMV
jgi:ribosome-associated protein